MARHRWPVLIGYLVFMIVVGVLGVRVFGAVESEGFSDPASDSVQVAEILTDEFGTTNPTVAGTTWNNNNISLIASVQLKFGAAAPPPPPPAAPAVTPPSFMVFFDWDRSTLSQQALATIRQAADAFKARGSARITATGHTAAFSASLASRACIRRVWPFAVMLSSGLARTL